MADTAKIDAAWADLFTWLGGLNNAPPTTPPFKIVVGGPALPHQYERPFLSVHPVALKTGAGRVLQDKTWIVTVALRVVIDAPPAAAPFDRGAEAVLEKVAAVNDKLDAYLRPAGVSGLENPAWDIDGRADPKIGDILVAECKLELTVHVTRGANV